MNGVEAFSAIIFSVSSSAQSQMHDLQLPFTRLTNREPGWWLYSTLVPLLQVDGQPEWHLGMHGRVERSKVPLCLQGNITTCTLTWEVHYLWGFLQLTDIRHILFSEKFGIMVITSFSAKNSTSNGSIPFYGKCTEFRHDPYTNVGQEFLSGEVVV